MKLEVHAPDYELDRPFYRHLRRRMGLALADRYGHAIRRVRVDLRRAQATPSDGVRVCTVELRLLNPGQRYLVTHGRHMDRLKAVDQAFLRAAYALHRMKAWRRRPLGSYHSAA